MAAEQPAIIAPHDTAVVRASGLTKSFGSDRVEVHALRSVALSVPRGQMLAIMGPSGSGKSTLLHILGGIETPTAGQVWIDNVELTALTELDRTLLRRRRLGFVFQSFNLLPMLNVVENVTLPLLLDGMPKREAEQRARTTLEWVEMTHRLDHLPTQLSGGEQQRVAIARALVVQPALLLADEPTGNLDTARSRDVTQLLRQMADKHRQTVIIVTHEPRVAAVADRLLHLIDGEIRYDGPPSEHGLWLEANRGSPTP